jgi:hypothetical protein
MEQLKNADEKFNELKQASIPLIKYLCENHHPHVTAIVTATGIEIMEGLMSFPTIEYLID